LLFLTVEGDPKSGAFYLLDRKSSIWYSIDFEDEQFGGYSVEDFDELARDCKFLALVERPSLLRSGLNWVLSREQGPVAGA
jgi:predicted glycosyltransferase involved in capsule biosynthesis